MSRTSKTFIVTIVDMCIIWVAVLASYLLRFDGELSSIYGKQMIQFAIILIVVCAVTFTFFRLYRHIWQYASIGEVIELLKAITVGIVISYALTYFVSGSRIPFSVALRTVELMILLMVGARFTWRMIRISRSKFKKKHHNVLIVGAGDCGVLVAKDMMTSTLFDNSRIVGFIDDDANKHKMKIFDIPVLGSRQMILKAVEDNQVQDIIIAMPSVGRSIQQEIINICKETGASVKIIPSINDLIHGSIAVQSMRNVEVEDLLGRDPVATDLAGIAGYVSGKTVLVTGAGGSIGSELCRQIAMFNPECLMLLGHGENSIYTIEMELRNKYPNLKLETIIADIQDMNRLENIFSTFYPQVIFHAAAHKHVPLMERNPSEAVKNNVFGTMNVANCADRYGAERFVMISSDKAVNPSSIMGATKRIAEMYIQSLDQSSKTQFVAVRFGNVLGSRGSVIPRFKEQIEAGGPVTVTHPDMVRYFMTIPEAVSLVIQAGAFANGGEIFILDMGEPVRIVDLATDLIRLSGYEPGVDIKIAFTGLREGEKLFEELLTDEESVTATHHKRIFIGKPMDMDRAELASHIERFERVMDEGQGDIREIIESLVPLYSNVS
ncbi:polysaccharide biosynthesis protein [Paenibacillus sp. GXUN7292]|uniref:polysaccharide biosynthesis protein n=1 Tax=Paenibacillus sp. GXUN7292 TaxID=3422499 RepID=UPI003D7CBC41